MSEADRLTYDTALERARATAYGAGEFVGQENFMLASEIRALAAAAQITPTASVLDLCCGVAGPGRLIAREFGCNYLGVDSSATAVSIARDRARGTGCRFMVSCVPPVPTGAFDVVLLLETLLAFPEKARLFHEIAAALNPSGRFAFTLEEGQPLTDIERTVMPQSDTVWLTPLPELERLLESAGLRVRSLTDCSSAHHVTAESLLNSYASDAQHIVAQVGRKAFDDLLDAHVLWTDWLQSGRVRKFAVVAEKAEG